MRIAIERNRPQESVVQLTEIVTPRTNTAAISAAQNFFSRLGARRACSLEIAATPEARWFEVRTDDPVSQRHAVEQLQVAYPQADVRPVDLTAGQAADAAAAAPDERVVACVLGLREPEYLPLRTFRDIDMSGDEGTEADPMLGILGALGTVPDGCRAISQLVLQAAPKRWTEPYQRLAIEHPLSTERSAGGAASEVETSSASVKLLAVVLLLIMIGIPAFRWYAAGEWLNLAKLAGVLAAGVAMVLCIARLVGHIIRQRLYHPDQVREKIAHPGYRAQLRLAVIGPAGSDPVDLQACLDRLTDAYGAFAQAFGNELVAHRLKLKNGDLRRPTLLGKARRVPVLNARELAGVWHLPHAQADVPLLERTGARRVLPLPQRVANGCRIGQSVHQGRSFPVCLSDAILLRHLLALAKTGRGKSSLLVRLALYVMQTLCAGGKRAALILIDPHRDLARQVLSVVPPEREPDLVYLDAFDQARPFGLNLVDAGLGWSRDQMLMIVLDILRREFSEAWGLRMEPAFRYALLTLWEANAAICSRNPNTGRDHQYTILDIPPLFSDPVFRRGVLRQVGDRDVRAWWAREVDRLPHAFQIEVSYPVETKIFKFAGIDAARHIFGQPRSTIDPLSWVSSGKVVIINTDAVLLGHDAAALIGDLLLNLVSLTIALQAVHEREDRARAMVIVDELQAMPGADYQTLLAEMGKFGASLVLATQSLGRLDALDRERNTALKATLFANVDTLLAFNASGEDALYLELELGEQVNRHDVAALGDFECYLRLPAGPGGSQSLCWVRLDPPPPMDLARQRLLADASAARYGRDVAEVERSLRAAFDRIERAHHTLGGTKKQDGGGGASTDPPASPPAAPSPSGGTRSPSAAGTPEAPAPDRNAAGSAESSHGQQPPAADAMGQGGRRPVPARTQYRNDPTKRETQASFLDSRAGVASDSQRQSGEDGSKARRPQTAPEAEQS